MKPYHLLIIVLFSCSAANENIYVSQKEALLISPYSNPGRVSKEIRLAKKFRTQQYPEELSKRLFESKNDTIILVENYAEICLGCYPFSTKMLIKDTIYSYKQEFNNASKEYEYQFEKISLTNPKINNRDLLTYSVIIELIDSLKFSDQWNEHPLMFGANECLDGDHTLATVIFPSNNMESLYVRCWMPYFQRKNN